MSYDWRKYEHLMTEPYKALAEAHEQAMAEAEARREREDIIREALNRFRLEIVDEASPSIKKLMAALNDALSGR